MNVVEKKARWIARFVCAVAAATWVALLSAPIPSASADPCPNVEVVFARGTSEPPGVGGVGQAFIDALQSQVGDRSVGVYAVNYAASSDFGAGIDFARTFVDGIRDAGAHAESMAANCPNTKMVLGGYSQAPPWRVSSPRLPYRRKYLLRTGRTYLSPCRRRWPIMSPLWFCSENPRISSCAKTACHLSSSARCMPPRPPNCALPAMTSVMVFPVGDPASRTSCIR